MAGKIKRYIQLLYLFTKFDFYLEATYGLNFILATFGKILRIVLVLVFFRAITTAVPTIPQWDEPTLYVLAATFYITDLIASILFHRNLLFHLPNSIRDGTFDRILTKPVSQLFHAAFNRIDVSDFLAFLPFFYFWWYIVTRFDLSFAFKSVLLYIFLVILAIVFIFALVLILGSISFWTIQGDGFGRFVDNITGAARFPLDIFPSQFKTVVFYVFPIVILSTLPTQALVGTVAQYDIIYAVCFTVILLSFSLWFWNTGVHNYQSASS